MQTSVIPPEEISSCCCVTMERPRLTVWCGPMMAGKTQALVRTYRMMPEKDRIAVKPAIDTRYSATDVVAHSGESIPAVALNNLQDIEKVTSGVSHVFIDEGQFFIDLAEKCHALLAMDKNVYVAGLSATAQQRPWQSMSEIMAMADDIVHIKVKNCQLCGQHPAPHTILRPTSSPQSGRFAPTIKIGGGDLYMAVCRNCLSSL